MDIDQLVTDTFADHEHLAPNEDAILSAVQRRISTRQSRVARPLAIAAGVAVVAGATGVAVVLNRGHQHHARPVAAATTHVAPIPAASSRPPVSIAPLTMPYDLGWLPNGSVHYLTRRLNLAGASGSSRLVVNGEYMTAVTTSHSVLDIDVQQMGGGLDGVRFKSGPGASISINARRGIESSNAAGQGGYEIYFLDSAGGLMYVNTANDPGSHVSPADLVAIGRHVAEGVRLPGTAKVRPSFRVGYVPAGFTVRTFEVADGLSGVPVTGDGEGSSTRYDLGPSSILEPDVEVSADGLAPRAGTPGRSVQGHPTSYRNEQGERTLSVLGAVHGNAVQISTTLPLSEIYKIADGLILPQ